MTVLDADSSCLVRESQVQRVAITDGYKNVFLQARPFCIARESQAHRTASTDGYKNVVFASNLPTECVDKDCVTFIL